MAEATIYYNPKCQTCRKALALLEKKGYKTQIIEYLKNPPSEAELDTILKKLQLEPAQIAREKEPIYAEKAEGKTLTRAQWLKLLHAHPVLIQRPIVVIGERAIVARPPERLHEIL